MEIGKLYRYLSINGETEEIFNYSILQPRDNLSNNTDNMSVRQLHSGDVVLLLALNNVKGEEGKGEEGKPVEPINGEMKVLFGEQVGWVDIYDDVHWELVEGSNENQQ